MSEVAFRWAASLPRRMETVEWLDEAGERVAVSRAWCVVTPSGVAPAENPSVTVDRDVNIYAVRIGELVLPLGRFEVSKGDTITAQVELEILDIPAIETRAAEWRRRAGF